MRTKKKGGASISPLMASGAGVARGSAHGKGSKRGAGWWDDFTGWVNTNVKKPKYVSRGLKAYSSVDPSVWGQAAGVAGDVAGALGWGRRKRRRR